MKKIQLALYSGLTLALLTAGGCTTIEEKAVSFVGKYCELDKQQREANREAINTAIAPNHIRLTCEGDEPAGVEGDEAVEEPAEAEEAV